MLRINGKPQQKKPRSGRWWDCAELGAKRKIEKSKPESNYLGLTVQFGQPEKPTALVSEHDARLKRTITPPLETCHEPHLPVSPHAPLPSPCRRLDHRWAGHDGRALVSRGRFAVVPGRAARQRLSEIGGSPYFSMTPISALTARTFIHQSCLDEVGDRELEAIDSGSKRIRAGIVADPDTHELTDMEMAELRPLALDTERKLDNTCATFKEEV